MPRALRCSVELNIHAVSAPGVWLPSKEDVYLSISILGHYKITRMLPSVFPLFIHDTIHVHKTYYHAWDPADVMESLEDDLVVIELLQLSEYTDGAVRLASYCCCARDFLFPFPSLAPIYTSADRELLLDRTVAFPGISPKLEFTTKTVIKESISAEFDALEDATDMQRTRCSRRSRSPTRRPRSSSLPRRMTSSLSDSLDTRPPFVVRKLDKDLIGRLPGGGPDAHGKSKGYRAKGYLSKSKSDTEMCGWPHHLRHYDVCPRCMEHIGKHGTPYRGHYGYYHQNSYHLRPLSTCSACWNYRSCPCMRAFPWSWCRRNQQYRSSATRRRDLSFKSYKQDDLDAEVSALTSRSPTSSYVRPRPRSASPVLNRPSFRARYSELPSYTYYPSYYSSYSDYLLRRRLEDYRLARIYDPLYTYYPYTSSYRRYLLDKELSDLELSTRLAKTRRYLY